MLYVLFGFLFFAWIIFSLVWLSTFVQAGRTPWAKRGYRYRRVRRANAIAAIACFVLMGIAAQGLPPDQELTAGRNPVTAPIPADAPDTPRPAKSEALSDSEMQYVTSVQIQATELGASMTRFAELAEHPEIFDDTWKFNTAKELAIWQIAYSEAQKLQPSDRFAAVQSCWVGALRGLNNAANEIASGLDHMDVGEINLATGAISHTNGTIHICAQEMAIISAAASK